MPELTIQESHDEGGNLKVLYLEGFIDSATVVELRKKLDELISHDIFKIILDLTKLAYIGSAGISIFLEYFSTFQGNGGTLVLCSVPEKARKVMTMVGMENIVRVFDTQRDALSFFQEDIQPKKEPESKQGKIVSFPVEGTCPHCNTSGMIPHADIFRCQACEKLLYVSGGGDISPLGTDGNKSLQMGKWFKLKIPSNIIYLNSVRAFLTSILGESGMSDDDTSEIELAVDEAISNVMEHAYGMDKTKQIGLSFFLTDEYMLVKLKDTGIPFDITAKIKEEQSRIQSSEKRGRGCFIIGQIMDRLDYQTIPEVGNELVMLRYFKRRKTRNVK